MRFTVPFLLLAILITSPAGAQTLALAAGPQNPVSASRIEPAAGAQRSPRGAALGDLALVTWLDGLNVHGARIDAHGNVLDARPLRLVPGLLTLGSPEPFDVAAGRDRFMVVSGSYNVTARTVSRDGVVSDAHNVTQGFTDRLHVAASSDGMTFLVVSAALANGDNGEVWSFTGTLVDADGRPLHTSVDEGRANVASRADFDFAVVADGSGFALITADGQRLIARRLTPFGEIVSDQTLDAAWTGGPELRASSDGATTAIVARGGSQLVLWSGSQVTRSAVSGAADNVVMRQGQPAVTAIADRSINAAPYGAVEIRPPHRAIETAPVSLPDGVYVAFSTSRDASQETDVFGALAGTQQIAMLEPAEPNRMITAVATAANRESLVLWNEDSTVRGVPVAVVRHVDAPATAVGPEIVLSSNGFLNAPQLATDGTAFLLTWSSATGPISAQFLNADGTPSGARFDVTSRAMTFFGSFYPFSQLAWDGKRYVVTYMNGFSSRNGTQAHVEAIYITRDGVVSDPIRITNDEYIYTRAASDEGTTAFLAQSGSVRNIYFLHDGQVSGPIAISPQVPVDANLIWTGSSFLVAWSENHLLRTAVLTLDGKLSVHTATAINVPLGKPQLTRRFEGAVAIFGTTAVLLSPTGDPLTAATDLGTPVVAPINASDVTILGSMEVDDSGRANAFVRRLDVVSALPKHRAARR